MPSFRGALLVGCLATSALVGTEARSEEAKPKLLLFVDADPARDRRARGVLQAISAQLADVRIEVKAGRAGGTTDVRQRLDQAASRAGAEGHAVGAVWIDTNGASDVLVFVVDVEGQRALVRRIRVEPGAEAAAFEEAGVVVRSTAVALLEGRAIGMEPSAQLTFAPAPPPPPPPPPPGPEPPPIPAEPVPAPVSEPTVTFGPAEAPPERPPARTQPAGRDHASWGRVALGAAYVGSVYVTQGPWQSGAALLGRYVAAFGGYVGLGYDVLPSSSVPTVLPGTKSAVTLDLSQRPVSGSVGYERRVVQRLRLAAELAVVSDVVTRGALASSTAIPAVPSATRAVASLSPRARVAFSPTERVWLTGGGGADFSLGHFAYEFQPAHGAAVPFAVQPLVARPRVELGVAVDLF